jgi:catechol 2,3-dioxygenase-like lactoylglutathione lyase family enzyme
MFAIRQLRVPVADLVGAEGFWTALLGHVPEGQERDGALRYHVDGIDLVLVPAPATGAEAPGGPLGFRLSHDDLDAVLARLPPDAGAAIRTHADGTRHLETRDPDGNLVRVDWRMPER